MHSLTFKPLKSGKYRCNQTKAKMTQKQIIAYVSSFASNGNIAIGRTPEKKVSAPPKKKAPGQSHPSKYRAKHR